MFYKITILIKYFTTIPIQILFNFIKIYF